MAKLVEFNRKATYVKYEEIGPLEAVFHVLHYPDVKDWTRNTGITLTFSDTPWGHLTSALAKNKNAVVIYSIPLADLLDELLKGIDTPIQES